MNIDLSEIRELIAILNQTDVTELTIEAENFKLSIRKEGGKAVVVPSPGATPTAVASVPIQTPGPTVPPPPPPPPEKPALNVDAPMVGTFYRAPAPDAANFVEIGDTIRIGQTVCIIEAMKLMNAIESDVGGRVVEILVQNGEPIEFGQALMRVEPV
ncbi:MAG: acetyl-CoA carboxylase biotin carboxyl carrier protein [Anaerolineae bacterium]|nr:acetyl-CoA carboxylase biotin carboxyl carrier protein [Gloeobacterales cyanobacterium ES-bin-313]